MDPFLGEIRLFAGPYAPQGWAFCDGQLLQVNQYAALFSLLGARYGGNGSTTFALPDLRGRWPVGVGPQDPIGSVVGAATVTLTAQHLPPHAHGLLGSAAAATSTSPTGGVPAATTAPGYLPGGAADQSMAADVLAPVGSSAPLENRPPYLGLHHIIAVTGIFPSRS